MWGIREREIHKSAICSYYEISPKYYSKNKILFKLFNNFSELSERDECDTELMRHTELSEREKETFLSIFHDNDFVPYVRISLCCQHSPELI